MENSSYDFEHQLALLRQYAQGDECEKVYALACEILEHNPDYGEAYYQKALCLYVGNGVEQDINAAVETAIKGTEIKDNTACRGLLIAMFEKGFDGCIPSVAIKAQEAAGRAAMSFGSGYFLIFITKRAADQNNESDIADAYNNAYKFYCIARNAQAEDAEKCILELFVQDNLNYAIKIPEFDCDYEIKMAMPYAESGDAEAMLAMYSLSLQSSHSNINECLVWLRKAAAEGNELAVSWYGGMWRNGLIDDAQFDADSYIKGYKKLEQQSSDSITAEKMGIVGECYMSDAFSVKDVITAERYLTQAADLGDIRSIRLLALGLQEDGALRTDEQKALRYLDIIIKTDSDEDFIVSATISSALIHLKRGTAAEIQLAQNLCRRIADSKDEQVRKAVKSILEIDIKNDDERSEPSKPKGGCYIATAVYGGYDCPQVCTLRRYRDDVLADSSAGRLFIRIYYKISPKLVKHFGDSKAFNIFWRNVLDKWVLRLHAQGFNDNPYTDKNIF